MVFCDNSLVLLKAYKCELSNFNVLTSPETRAKILVSNRAYSGSEFVSANTLAKWNKFEPNEINFSQGSINTLLMYLTPCPLGRLLFSADDLYKQFGPRPGPTFCRV